MTNQEAAWHTDKQAAVKMKSAEKVHKAAKQKKAATQEEAAEAAKCLHHRILDWSKQDLPLKVIKM